MTLPRDVYPESLSRLPLVEREAMDEQGKKFYDTVTGPHSRTLVGLQGPSGIWLHSPELGERMRAVNQYLRYETALERRLTELAILVTARELDNQFEWTAHEPVALKEGLDPGIIDAVKYRKPTSGLGTKEALIIDLGRKLFRERRVDPETFAHALEAFGPRGIVELAAVMGNYAGTAIMLNLVDQQVRPDQTPLL
jgi:4-carboxymuconolactone decarboxylase